MTFESLAVAGLSLGLSYTEILNTRIGLIVGMLNEKANQMADLNKKQKTEENEVVQGDANMLMNM